MVIGLAGGGYGLLGTLGDRLTNGSATGAAIVAGVLFALLGVYGAARVPRNPDRASLGMIAATIGLVLALGWWATIAAALLLLGAALALLHPRS